jgi:hypothetical protein
MSQHKTDEVSEAEIAVHWQEEDYVYPPHKFVAQANLTDTSQTASRSTPLLDCQYQAVSA